jgi:predicted DNA-binding mobile mystery protein A
MSVREVVSSQYREIVNKAAKDLSHTSLPTEGWLCTVRKALKMSAAELARRLGKSRSLVSHTEKKEPDGGVTIKTMKNMAEAMGCRFVYAIVPENSIEDILEAWASKKARRIVEKTSQHMALEAQELSADQVESEIRRISQELLRKMPSDFWKDNT